MAAARPVLRRTARDTGRIRSAFVLGAGAPGVSLTSPAPHAGLLVLADEPAGAAARLRPSGVRLTASS